MPGPQHVTYIGRENGKQIVLTGSEYRILLYVSRHDVVQFFTNSSGHTQNGWELKSSGEPVTATVEALLRKGYLEKAVLLPRGVGRGEAVSVTAKGREVMRKYWEKRKDKQ